MNGMGATYICRWVALWVVSKVTCTWYIPGTQHQLSHSPELPSFGLHIYNYITSMYIYQHHAYVCPDEIIIIIDVLEYS